MFVAVSLTHDPKGCSGYGHKDQHPLDVGCICILLRERNGYVHTSTILKDVVGKRRQSQKLSKILNLARGQLEGLVCVMNSPVVEPVDLINRQS